MIQSARIFLHILGLTRDVAAAQALTGFRASARGGLDIYG